MAASFLQLAQIANSQTFQQRVSYAMSVGAATVYNEASTVTSHNARAAYASKVANGNYNLQAAAAAVLSNATIAAEAVNDGSQGNAIPDSDIQFAVNSLWNLLTGV
jgi:polyferredoxin